MFFFITLFDLPDPCPVRTGSETMDCDDAKERQNDQYINSSSEVYISGTHSTHGFDPSKSTFNPSASGDSAITWGR